MKWMFYMGLTLLLALEMGRIYLLSPIPGSQGLDLVQWAHLLDVWNWAFWVVLLGWAAAGSRAAWRGRKWLMVTLSVVVALLIGAIRFTMAAEGMFLQPKHLVFADAGENVVSLDRLVLGVESGGEARAYPIQYLAHHHQVLDAFGGKRFMLTYCSVCRTGRVFEPIVNGEPAQFRLVGMDHFNAMFEDAATKTWWRQATGEAVAGKLSGQALPEYPCLQTSLRTWLRIHPESKIMQPDPDFQAQYDGLADYESGQRKNGLTGTDTTTWAEKSWVVGIEMAGVAKAYPWRRLQEESLIHDVVGGVPILIALGNDDMSLFAFRRPAADWYFTWEKDEIVSHGQHFDLRGHGLDGNLDLAPAQVYQEFWHSWRTFHPNTGRG